MTRASNSPEPASPGDYLLYADSYWLAAKRLFNSHPLQGIPMPGLEAHHLLPGLTLVCISIELSLKAVLVLHGFDHERLRKEVGHDLVRALGKASKLGLFADCEELNRPRIDAEIEYLNSLYKTPILKYPHKPRSFAGRPEYLDLAQFLIRASASCCSVEGLSSATEPPFDGPIVGRITNTATSGTGLFRQAEPADSEEPN